MEVEVPKYPAPPPPAPKRLSRPKITLQIPETPYRGPPSATSRFSTPSKYHGWPPNSPQVLSTHKFHPNFNPEWYSHMTQASDFIMNTAKSGLSFGEKTAFWIVSKLKRLSKKWFTHFFLMLCLFLYSAMGAAIFMALEGPVEAKYALTLAGIRKDYADTIREMVLNKTMDKVPEENITLTIVDNLVKYEAAVKECVAKLPDNNSKGGTWTFINSMFYAGTIFTTIGKGFSEKKYLVIIKKKYVAKLPDNSKGGTWTFINSTFYAGIIFYYYTYKSFSQKKVNVS